MIAGGNTPRSNSTTVVSTLNTANTMPAIAARRAPRGAGAGSKRLSRWLYVGAVVACGTAVDVVGVVVVVVVVVVVSDWFMAKFL